MANVKPISTLSKSYPMSGGDGPHSYTLNSSYQKAAIESAKPKTTEAILAKLDLENPKFHQQLFAIADFGCSTGPNTFDVVQNIVESVKLKHQREETKGKDYEHNDLLEFHVFFNDQPNNDFNTLFKTLPRYYLDHNTFAVGVPGSFYGRVFPRKSLHIGHTSYTLHWLSRAPEDVCNRNSQAWNQNSIQCTNLVEEVTDAYKRQFKKDMETFLEARAEELVSGGLMIILGQCLPDGVPMIRTWKGVVTEMIGDCLIDMARSGIISNEKVESFNLPIYFPNFGELKEVVEKNECFSTEVMEEVKHPMEDKPLSKEYITSLHRAIFHGVIEEHFGDNVIDALFDRFAKKLNKNPVDFAECQKDMQYLVLLKRNVD